jgi:hypothetical protein
MSGSRWPRWPRSPDGRVAAASEAERGDRRGSSPPRRNRRSALAPIQLALPPASATERKPGPSAGEFRFEPIVSRGSASTWTDGFSVSAHRENAGVRAERRVRTSKRVRTRTIARVPARSSRQIGPRPLLARVSDSVGHGWTAPKENALLDPARCRVVAVVAAMLHVHAHTNTAVLVSRRAVDCATQLSRSLQGGSQCPS